MKFIAATLATLSMLVSASAQADPTKTREDVRMVAPALEKYAQGTLLGDVWKRPGLSVRDRSVVTLAALIARDGSGRGRQGCVCRAQDRGGSVSRRFAEPLGPGRSS